MDHLLHPNVALITARSNKAPIPDHFFCADTVVETKCGESTTQSVTIPLWLYSASSSDDLFSAAETARRSNLSSAFIEAIESALGRPTTPEEIFAYMYAVLYSPAYRERYGFFLRRGFPRVPCVCPLFIRAFLQP